MVCSVTALQKLSSAISNFLRRCIEVPSMPPQLTRISSLSVLAGRDASATSVTLEQELSLKPSRAECWPSTLMSCSSTIRDLHSSFQKASQSDFVRIQKMGLCAWAWLYSSSLHAIPRKGVLWVLSLPHPQLPRFDEKLGCTSDRNQGRRHNLPWQVARAHRCVLPMLQMSGEHLRHISSALSPLKAIRPSVSVQVLYTMVHISPRTASSLHHAAHMGQASPRLCL
jgi:hypothetical protein